ncbi:MAG: undecaprenyldiphospho-muramoylpentapeptide beta-N-acetylglucosaminyltransferase [Candidatus Omnitrophica bacterium]|nr:undecaprenyldiphospho-muramoylpentapeptide beta-N-acetylglucosaminyltransferase [Candidatus Omnitrophota bacterium]
MANVPLLKVLLVAEGSGGHLIPALQVAESLAAQGVATKLWYAQRWQTAALADALARGVREGSVDVDPIAVGPSGGALSRLWQCGQLWSRAQRCFDAFAPDVVVGFGGWVCAPVVLAACRRGIGCVVHEQNVVLGRANRWLARWADRVAVSFDETQPRLRRAGAVTTGMPVRPALGSTSRAEAARRFGLSAERPTLLILGGSQGSRVMNQMMMQLMPLIAPRERATWQFVHLTGAADVLAVQRAYQVARLAAWVAPFLTDMDAAYAQADLVLARAGASTVAELARCGLPSVLIPFPYAGGHQRANARVVEACGGGLVIEEAAAAPQRVLDEVRRLLSDAARRAAMSRCIRTLSRPDAAQRLTQEIMQLATTKRCHA